MMSGKTPMGNQVPEKYPRIDGITDAQRVSMVKEIFSTITAKYDFLNRFLSLRRDVYWRKFAAKKMRFGRTNHYLDVACGTGDLSIAAALRHPQIQVTGLDFVPAMVETAKQKVQKKNLAARITLTQGDALALPFADSTLTLRASPSASATFRTVPVRLQKCCA